MIQTHFVVVVVVVVVVSQRRTLVGLAVVVVCPETLTSCRSVHTHQPLNSFSHTHNWTQNRSTSQMTLELDTRDAQSAMTEFNVTQAKK